MSIQTADALMGVFGMKRVKPKRCKVCKGDFYPKRSMQPTCDYPAPCAARYAEQKAAKKAASRAAADRKKTRAQLEAMKGVKELIPEAQEAFNAFIRYRDKDLPCIDCGKPYEPQKPGGSMDAGHMFARSARPHLRFNEDNCFGQRKNCNRPGGTTFADFRAGAVARIGEERVAAVEANRETHKWTREEVREIRDTYRRKLREMKRGAK